MSWRRSMIHRRCCLSLIHTYPRTFFEQKERLQFWKEGQCEGQAIRCGLILIQSHLLIVGAGLRGSALIVKPCEAVLIDKAFGYNRDDIEYLPA